MSDYPLSYVPIFLCNVIDTNALHAILWELFEKKPFQPHPDFLWKYYTSGKYSWWLIKPDEVLEDIMKVYNELNK